MGLFEDAVFDKWGEKAGFPQQLKQAKAYVDTWEAQRQNGTGLLLTGSVGVGKTFLAMCIKNAVAAKGAVTVALNAPELYGRISSTWGKGDVKESELFDVLIDADLLVMDDLGISNGRAWTGEALYRIVDGRYRHKRPIIATANIAAADLPTNIGARTADRLLERCSIITMTGPSYRKILAKRREEV